MRLISRLALAALVCSAAILAVGGGLSAGEKSKVKVGDKAPAFASVDENGKAWKSSDLVGKKILVLYFYPADFTGGCTAQACGFRDAIEKLGSKGIEVVGVSGDSAATHMLFKKYHNLPFTLLADEKGAVASAFAIPTKAGGQSPTIEKVDGKEVKGSAPRGVTILRWTVVIDKAGNIAAIDAISQAGKDAERVAALVNKLATK
jgi:peroxiredoxin Q/BCP